MDVRDIAQLVAQRILPDRPARVLDVKTVHAPASLVHRLHFAVDGATRSVFVKLPHDAGPKHAMYVTRLRREFEITQRVKARFPETSELKTVSPAGYIETIEALVTWEVPGKPLLDIINANTALRLGVAAPHLEYLCELAGQWLRHFHRIEYPVDAGEIRTSLRRYYEVRLDELASDNESRVTRIFADSLLRTIDTWLDEALAGPDTEIVLCHNDFSPHNIIATEKQICVLDFSFAGAGFPIFDVACYWHKLEDLKTSRIRSSKKIDALQQRFLAGYGDAVDWMQPQAKLGLARLVLSKMCTLRREPSLRPDHWINGKRRYAGYLAALASNFEVLGTS